MINKKHTLRIVFRTSMAPSIYIKRPFGLERKTMMIKCLKSLLISCLKVKDRVFITLIDDSSPKEVRDKIQLLLSEFPIKYEFKKIEVQSNRESLRACYNIYKKSKEDLLFLVNDDFLFVKEAISYILEAYDNKIIGTDQFVIHPTDYPERYEKIYPCYTFLGGHCHWRSISHATGNEVIPKKVYKKYEKIFDKFVDYLIEGETINKIWNEVPLINPLPAIATHLNDDTLSPFTNWGKLLEELS